MKKYIIYILLILNVFAATNKVEDLLKTDSQKNSKVTEGLVKKQGKIEKLIGQAFLQKDGSTVWLQLVENTMIDEKVTIVTMADSELKLKLDNDISVNIGAKTKLYIDSLKSKPKSESLTETGLKLLFGKVYSNINKKLETGAKYEIKSGSVVAGVRGTRFLVTNLQGGRVEIKVYEGFVVITNVVENKDYTIMKNQKVNIDGKGNTEEVKDLDVNEQTEELTDDSISEEIQELKDLFENQDDYEDEEYQYIKDIIIEGTWQLEPEQVGNKIIITID